MPNKFDVLKGKMDKIRAEKERLTRLRELEEAEDNLQRAISEEERRRAEGGYIAKG